MRGLIQELGRRLPQRPIVAHIILIDIIMNRIFAPLALACVLAVSACISERSAGVGIYRGPATDRRRRPPGQRLDGIRLQRRRGNLALPAAGKATGISVSNRRTLVTIGLIDTSRPISLSA